MNFKQNPRTKFPKNNIFVENQEEIHKNFPILYEP